MHPRLPPPYHSAPQESSMPVNATFPANFKQTPGDDTPSPFRARGNYQSYEMPGKFVANFIIVFEFYDFTTSCCQDCVLVNKAM
jgi:hypothetical protein